jgi:hypothetical protein
MLPGIDAVADILTEIAVDEETVKNIVLILEENAQALQEGHPGSLNAAYLGGSDAASTLGYHTSLAHQHVVKAMEQMVAGLTGYRENILKFHKELSNADDASASSTATGATRVDAIPSMPQASACTTAPNVQDNSSCTLPTGGNR